MTDTSPRQIAANRLNAAHSTGPRSARGKALACLNARKHGLLANQTLIPGEDAAELAELEEPLSRRLRPVGVLQQELFDEIVAGFWRLRRLRRAEVAVFTAEIARQRRLTAMSGEAKRRRRDGIDPETRDLGTAFGLICDTLGRLDRYETSILRRTRRALTDLQGLQAEDVAKAEDARPAR